MPTKRIRAALALCSSIGVFCLTQPAFADGAALYKEKCASCHGADGKAETAVAKAMKVPALTSPEVQKMSAADIVKHMKETAKHPAGVKSLSDSDATAVAEAVKALGGGQ